MSRGIAVATAKSLAAGRPPDWATGTAEVSSVAVATRRAQASYEALGCAEAAVYNKKGLR